MAFYSCVDSNRSSDEAVGLLLNHLFLNILNVWFSWPT